MEILDKNLYRQKLQQWTSLVITLSEILSATTTFFIKLVFRNKNKSHDNQQPLLVFLCIRVVWIFCPLSEWKLDHKLHKEILAAWLVVFVLLVSLVLTFSTSSFWILSGNSNTLSGSTTDWLIGWVSKYFPCGKIFPHKLHLQTRYFMLTFCLSL